jgi:hypothetical protein
VAAAADVQQPSAKDVLEGAADRSEAEPFDARAFRRSLNSTGRYTRKPSNDASSLALMEEHGVGYSTTGLVAQMRETGYTWKQGDVLVKLAEAYGFCWGVERAVQMAYEARKAYPGQRIHITNEIIHNPSECTWPEGCAWLPGTRAGGNGGSSGATRQVPAAGVAAAVAAAVKACPALATQLQLQCIHSLCSVLHVRCRREPAAEGDGCTVY